MNFIRVMQNLLRVLLLSAAFAAPAIAQREIGTVDVASDSRSLPVRVSANTPELNALALQAFGSHGRYRVVASGFLFDIRFASLGGNQVRVDVTRGLDGAPIASEAVTGTSPRNGLLAAADVAVARTSGLGLRGYFTSRLAFIGERTGHKEVYVSDLFFGEVRQITSDRAIALSPRWSPDGGRLLYTSFFRSGFPDIYEINLSSNQRTTFVSFKGTNFGARFSPDGRQAAMVLTGEGESDIYVSNAQGRAVSRRTHSDFAKDSPVWSPDGSQLAFSMEPGPQIYVMPSAGGTPRRISRGISGFCSEPDWSRGNPGKIAFTMGVGRNFQIGVIDLASGQGGQVSKAAFDGDGPSWLPDGRHLVYTARTATASRICILDTETGKSTPVSPSSFGPALEANVWAQR
jgi:TolB protein